MKADMGGIINEKTDCMHAVKKDHIDGHPHVRVIYNNLPRQSQNKLFELLQNWSHWHAQHVDESNGEEQSLVECGHEIHFPALRVINVGRNDQKYTYCHFLMDGKPTEKSEYYRASDPIQQKKKEEEEGDEHINIPRYDRAYALALGSSNYSEDEWISGNQQPVESSRCFNCDSYAHSLKECPKPVDNKTVAIARNAYNKSKRKRGAAPIPHRRYFDDQNLKFEGIKAGILGRETREALGIGESDPPPWLHRMHNIGYPPAYLIRNDSRDQSSGIKMYSCYNEEEIVETKSHELPEMPEKKKMKMSVRFPGINAPIPDKADERQWLHNGPRDRNDNLGRRESEVSKHNPNQKHRIRESRLSNSRCKKITRRRK